MADTGRRKGETALLLALAAGETVRDAAKAANIGERTATRRVADPAFRLRLAEVRGDLFRQAQDRLAGAMTAAADTLRNLLSARSENVRLGAARTIIELGVKVRDALEMEERMSAVESRLASTGGTP
jgi:hypothetical protein